MFKGLNIFILCGLLTFPLYAESIKLETQKTAVAISPYIYGQFIEHLGRCIYGGIWAEMVEDRKFYHPITDKYDPWGTDSAKFWKAGEFKFLKASPWRVVGPAGSVTMEKTARFTEEQSPAINLPGGVEAGISQEGLALVQGMKYQGRIVLAGDATAAPIIVRLVLDNRSTAVQQISRITPEYQAYPLEFKAPAASGQVKLEIVSKGKGQFRIGTLSLMPADNIKGWRKDVVALLKELDSPIYRWPGGNFVSGYNWRDGVGERDRRPPRKNPAWKGVEPNDVGIHEYMELLELLKSEAYIAVNTGLGTPEEVAAEVAYCLGSADTPMGKLRARNGHPAPFAVRYWAVGNEMYGDWQLGHMPLAEYVKKHQRVVEAMRKVSPSIQLVGVGAVGEWSQTMLKECSGDMNLISEHIYCKDNPELAVHIGQLAAEIRRVAAAHREYRQKLGVASDKAIPIAMDEWNFWYGDYIYGELGVRYFLKDGLGVAMGLHEYFRNSDLYQMANYAQTVNVIGAIKTSRTQAAMETTGLILKLYRQQFGTLPIPVSGDLGGLDVSAAWTSDKKALTLAIVNTSPQARKMTLDPQGIGLQPKGLQWSLGGPDPMAYNEPDKPLNLDIQQRNYTLQNSTLESAPYSATLYRFQVDKGRSAQ